MFLNDVSFGRGHLFVCLVGWLVNGVVYYEGFNKVHKTLMPNNHIQIYIVHTYFTTNNNLIKKNLVNV